MDGRMDEWMDGSQMDRYMQMDGWKDKRQETNSLDRKMGE